MKRKFLSLFLAAVAVVSLSACGGGAGESSAPSSDGGAEGQAESLTIAITNDENTLAPYTYVSATGLTVNRLIYDTLFTTDENNEIIPWMVEEDYTVEDARVYTMTLKEGLRFHNGQPVTAEDVAFSFTYPATQSVAGLRSIANQVESVEVLDERTLRFTLTESDVNFLRDGFCVMRIVCKSVYDGVEDATQVTESVGSGMYRLVDYRVGQYYRLEAVEDYFAGTPRVKTINLPIMENDSAVQQGLLAGELDASTSTIGVEVLDTFRSLPQMTVYASAGYSPMLMNINNGRPPLDEADFRRAMAYAIDVNGIMGTLFGEYCQPGTRGLVRSDLPYAVPGLEYTYDPQAADQLLDSLGYTERNSGGIRLDQAGNPLELELLVYANNPIRIRAAELVAQQLAQVGISIQVTALEMDTVDAYVWPDFDVTKGRDYDLAMWGWGSSISMSYLVQLCAGDLAIGSDNLCGYQNDQFDALVASDYLGVTSTEEMTALLQQLQPIVADDIPLINFGFADTLQVCNTGAYDGWVPVMGGNVVNIFSFLPQE